MQQNFYFTEKRFYKNYLEDIINTIEKETNNKLKLKIPEPPVTPKTPEETISQVSEKYAEADVLDFLLGIEEELADLKETRRFLYQDKNFINIIEYQKVRKKIEELKAKLAEKVGLTRRLNAKKHLTADEDEIKNLQRRCGWMAKEIFEIKEKIETTSRELQREHTKIEMPYNIQNEIDEKTKELSILRNSSDFNSNKKEIRTLENEINKLKGKKKLLISMFENAEINERIKELEKLSKKKYKTLGKKSPSKKRGCNTAETTNIKEE